MKGICAMRLVGIINPPLVYVNASKIFCKATQKFFDLKATGIDIAKGRVDVVAKPARHGTEKNLKEGVLNDMQRMYKLERKNKAMRKPI